jgi:hypothetical protein
MLALLLIAGALALPCQAARADQDAPYQGQVLWMSLDDVLKALSQPRLCGACFGIESATRDGVRVVATDPANHALKVDIATAKWSDLDLSSLTVTVGVQDGGKIGYLLYVGTRNKSLAVHHDYPMAKRSDERDHLLWTAEYGADSSSLNRLADLLATLGARLDPHPPKVACMFGTLPEPGSSLVPDPGYKWSPAKVGRIGETANATYRVSALPGPDGRQAVEFSLTNLLAVPASVTAQVALTSSDGQRAATEIGLPSVNSNVTQTDASLRLVPFAEHRCITRIEVTEVSAKPVPLVAVRRAVPAIAPPPANSRSLDQPVETIGPPVAPAPVVAVPEPLPEVAKPLPVPVVAKLPPPPPVAPPKPVPKAAAAEPRPEVTQPPPLLVVDKPDPAPAKAAAARPTPVVAKPQPIPVVAKPAQPPMVVPPQPGLDFAKPEAAAMPAPTVARPRPVPVVAKPPPPPVAAQPQPGLDFAKPMAVPAPVPAVARPRPVPVVAKPAPPPPVARPAPVAEAPAAGSPETVVINGVTFVKGREPKTLGSIPAAEDPTQAPHPAEAAPAPLPADPPN